MEIEKKYKPQKPKLKEDQREQELEVKNIPESEPVYDVEAIKEKQKKVVEEEKIRQEQKRVKSIKDAKTKKQSLVLGLIIFLVLLIFVPIFPVKDTVISDRKYLSLSDVSIEHPLGKTFSPFQFIRYQYEVANGSEYIKNARVRYQFPEMIVDISVEEYIPLAKDTENNVFFYENNEIIKRTDLDVYAPVVTGFDKAGLEQLLATLSTLDYDTLSQIDTITPAPTDEFPDLLKLGMDGNQIVYINSNQMKDKLPYYPQIKKIIDEKANGEPGIIHLELGDYYEPKS